jgi:1,4-alpha-glucan branching enzyme
MHFNYVELIGLAHHPFTGSWGYQVSGFYGCYSLLGTPDDFKVFVDTMHSANIGVIMDFVPCHFCKDACSFANFDGTPTFEYEDPRLGEQYEWGTKIFDFGRNEVRAFLIGSALFWARRYHIDGFRCDAVSCMVYRNFGREEGQWLPNKYGGEGNLEAMSLLRDLNRVMREDHPGVVMIAEESTSWEGVTDLRDCPNSGLGFDLKWDLGWMNDTLIYLEEPAKNRPSNHGKITGRDKWMHQERFVLPLSHDEVANMKGSLVDKMGRKEHTDFYDKIRLLCALYGFQVASPGRFLLFMGQEIGQGREWDYRSSIDWHEGEQPQRSQLCTWLSDLLGVYLHHSPLHMGDDEPHESSLMTGAGNVGRNFEWLESNAGGCLVGIIRRWRRERPIICICNFSPREHRGYMFRAPYWGRWEVLLNSDDPRYGGRGVGPGNMSEVWTRQGGRSDCSDSLQLDIPAEGCVLLQAPENFLDCRTQDSAPKAPQFSEQYYDDCFEYGFDDGMLGG